MILEHSRLPEITLIFFFGVLLSSLVFLLWYRQDRRRHNIQQDLLASEATADRERELNQIRAEFERHQREDQIQLATLKATLSEQVRQNDEKAKSLLEFDRLKLEYSKLETRLEEREKLISEQKEILLQTKESLFKEFELAAQRLFDEKHKNFQASSKTNLEMILGPFQKQLDSFHKKVDAVYSEENSQRNRLLGQIVELQKQTQKVSNDASNLAKALKGDSKIQGDWGEVVLERLLEQSGLVKGREYDTQKSYKAEDGKLSRPDFVVFLPENKHLIIDAKVSLKDYERFVAESDKNERQRYLTSHVDSIKSHIKNLSRKHYSQIPELKTLEFVFLFIPIEAAYLHAMEHSASLFQDAYEQRLILVSPSSLMVALRTVETIWRYEKQNKNAEEIASSAGRLYDQFALVIESLDQLGGHLKKTESAYDQLYKRFTSGRGNLLGRIDRLKSLGANVSKNISIKIESDENEEDSID